MSVTLRAPRKDSPSVELVENDGVPAVRKSYRHCSIFLRHTVGRLAIARECWALARLETSVHVPQLLDRPDSFTAVIEYMEGISLEKLDPATVDTEALATQAESLLADLKAAGVAHGDIGHDHWQSMGREANLIWTPDSKLVAIDFAGSVPIHSRFRPVANLGRLLSHHDTLLKAKILHHFPGMNSSLLQAHTQWPLELWELLRFLGKL